MKKGFTLIELLAVITVLALISVAIIPAIIKQVAKKTNDIDKTTTSLIYKATELYLSNDENYSKETGSRYCIKLESLVKANLLDKKIINFKNGKQIPLSRIVQVDVNNYREYEYKILGENENCTGEVSQTFAGTKVAAQEGETYKGIMYLDPTDLSKSCNSSNSVSATNTKSGCMKWYIYDDSGSNYKMILDHNTTARVKWNSSNSNVAYASSDAKAAMDATLTNWKVTPRFISAEEINAITGKTDFDVSVAGSWYYLNTKTQSLGEYNETTRSKYDWLYNNTHECKSGKNDCGCTLEDNEKYELYGNSDDMEYIYGYWTQDVVGTPGSSRWSWVIDSDGELDTNCKDNNPFGIRPVIEIAKSIVK